MKKIKILSIFLLIVIFTGALPASAEKADISISASPTNLNENIAGTSQCGEQLAEAEAAFLATLPKDGQVPFDDPAYKAAANKYIQVSKYCYEEIAARNPQTLQADTPILIDEGGIIRTNPGSTEYKLSTAKWGSPTLGTGGGTVTYSFMGNGLDLSSEGVPAYGSSVSITSLPGFQPCFITDIQNAFAAWQAVANIKFVQTTDSNTAFDAVGATGDIRIGAHTFDGPSQYLAHAYLPYPGLTGNGDMHFDKAENWTCNTSGIDIGVVAMHEIGHAIGLFHDDTAAIALMDPIYNASLTTLQSDDINGARAIYGAPGLSLLPPAGNDTVGTAYLITGLTYQNKVDTTVATPDPDTPDATDPSPINCTNASGISSSLMGGFSTVWYKYKTPEFENESIQVDTHGTNYDTYVAVFEGTEAGNLTTFVGCNDDSLDGQTSRYSFIGTKNTWYYFEVAYFYCFESDYPGSCVTPPVTGGDMTINVNITNTDVFIGTPKQKSYYLDNGQVVIDTYPSVLNGPVRVKSSIAQPIFTSQRAIYGNSFNELMGYPADQFATEYWFPWYDQVYMQTWILVGNPSATQTAYVDIYIGASKTSYSIPAGDRITPQFPGKLDGPVRVVSMTGAGTPTPIPIFASERSLYGTSFNEVMGYPANQFTTEYWFPWYDQVYMQTWILVGNPSATQTAYVDIYIGASKTSYSIPPNGRITPQFPGKLDGPVRVVSTTGAGTPTALPIFTSERSLYGSSFNEVMGYPSVQFTTDYWYTWYDNAGMSMWILVGNPSVTQTAYVDIVIGGVTNSFSIPPNGRITPQFSLDNGPVHVVSTTGAGTPTALPIFTSERSLYGPSFNEVMGYPGDQLTSEYWFTWYDSIYMNTQLLVSRP